MDYTRYCDIPDDLLKIMELNTIKERGHIWKYLSHPGYLRMFDILSNVLFEIQYELRQRGYPLPRINL